MKSRLLAILVVTGLLFVWSGITQLLPWGISAAQNITVLDDTQIEQLQAPNLIQLAPNSLTTSAFDAQFVNQISTYTTPTTFSWIVTQPLNTNYAAYFMVEIVTQLVVAIMLVGFLELTKALAFNKRLLLVLLAGAMAGAATYGQLMNWWRLPAPYALGVIVNLMVGWGLAAFITARFILPSTASART